MDSHTTRLKSFCEVFYMKYSFCKIETRLLKGNEEAKSMILTQNNSQKCYIRRLFYVQYEVATEYL